MFLLKIFVSSPGDVAEERSLARRVLATVRSDFYPRCAELPELLVLKEGSGHYDLLPPSAAEIGQMIRQPALAAGLRFEENPKTDERLEDVLRDAAVKNPVALPLLEFTLDELFKQKSETGVLTFAAYEKLGGVEGALARRAEEVLASLDKGSDQSLNGILRGLVSVGLREEEPPTCRWADLKALEAHAGNHRWREPFPTGELCR